MEKKIFIMIITLLALFSFQLFHSRTSNANMIPLDIYLYETEDNTPGGTPTETGNWVILPIFPFEDGSGYAILLEYGPSTEITNWSDVVKIDEGDPLAPAQPSVRLLSDVDEGPNPLWPSPGDVMDTNHLFIPETSPPTFFSWQFGTSPLLNFYVYSDAPEPIPEPTTMILIGSGLVGLVGLRRKLRKS